MMAESLFLNKKRIDLYDKPITRKVQIGDIGDIAARKSSYSYTVKIPRTANNLQVLEELSVMGNTSRKPFEFVVADYVVDSIYLVQNGGAIIRKTSKDFEINLIDGARGLGDLLGDKNLSDLPLSDLDHVLTTQNYVASYQHTDGYIYGIADFGRNVFENIKVESQAPSVFIHTLIERIFSSNGLSLQGEFFTTNDKYLNEVITPAKGYRVEYSVHDTESRGTAQTNEISKLLLSQDFATYEENFVISDIDLQGANVVNGEIVFSQGGTYKVDLNFNYSLNKTALLVAFRVNGVDQSLSRLSESETSELKSITFGVNAGDVVDMGVIASSAVVSEGNLYNIDFRCQCDISLYKLTGGQIIKPSMYLGDIKQIDLVKDIVNRYGLIMHPVQNTNEFKFKRLEAILSDVSSIDDWTNKLSSIDAENYNSNYAQINTANYQYPDTITVPNSDGEMTIDNYNAPLNKSLFSSPFEIPATAVGFFAGQRPYLIPIWGELSDETINIDVKLNKNSEETGAYLATNGGSIVLGSEPQWRIYEYLNIDPINNDYKVSGRIKFTDNALVCYYTSFDTFISYELAGNGNIQDFDNYPLTVPSNCAKIKVSGDTNVLPELIEVQEVTYKVAELKESPAKVMHVNRINTTVIAKFFDEATGITVNENIPLLNLDFISLQYFLNNFYKSFKLLINNYKKVSMTIALSVIDVFNLDFFKLKFFSQTGRYYYLNSVQFTPEKLAKIEAMEIQEFPTNQPPSQLGDYSFELNHAAVATLTESNFTVNYEDPELDEPLKVKLISGFNSNVVLRQAGQVVNSEMEILFSQLDLTATEEGGGTTAYSQSWVFAVADKGSLQYGDLTATLTVNVKEIVNTPPIAVARAWSPVWLQDYQYNEEGFTVLSGSDSYDTTGNIISWEWSIQSKPSSSNAYIAFPQDTSTPATEARFPPEDESVGFYTFKLKVTDQYGLSDEDTVQVEVKAPEGPQQ